MAWGGKGGQVDRIRKTGKSTVERAVTADKKQKSNAAEIARLRKKIKTGGMSMKRGNLKRTLENKIRKLEGGQIKKPSTRKSKPSTPKSKPNKDSLKLSNISTSGRGAGRAAFKKSAPKKKKKSYFADSSQWD